MLYIHPMFRGVNRIVQRWQTPEKSGGVHGSMRDSLNDYVEESTKLNSFQGR